MGVFKPKTLTRKELEEIAKDTRIITRTPAIDLKPGEMVYIPNKELKKTIYLVPWKGDFGWKEGTRLFYSLTKARNYCHRNDVDEDEIERKVVRMEGK